MYNTSDIDMKAQITINAIKNIIINKFINEKLFDYSI